MKNPFIVICAVLFTCISITSCKNSKNEQSCVNADKSVCKVILSCENLLELQYNAIKCHYYITPSNYSDTYEKSQKVNRAGNEVTVFISTLKWLVISEATGKSFNEVETLANDAKENGESILSYLHEIDNSEAPQKILFDGNKSRIETLEKKIVDFANQTKEIVGAQNASNLTFDIVLEKDDYKNQTVASVVLMLNSLMLEILNAENETLSLLQKNYDANRYSFSHVKPVVVAKKDHLKPGETYEAEIILMAYDTANGMQTIRVGSAIDAKKHQVVGNVQEITPVDGKGKYSVVASGVGKHSFAGTIQVFFSCGAQDTWPFEASYYVDEP